MQARRFITFEGIDGAGKSTQIEAARARLAQTGAEVVLTREPGGTALGEAIRKLFLEQGMSAYTEALLIFAARREHLERVVWPALARGAWVLCDRFTDASFAYQGAARGLGADAVAALANWVHPAFSPRLTFLFDLPPLAAAERRSGRAESDRIEREQRAFHERVRAGYLARAEAEPQRFCVLDASQDMERVREQLLIRLAALLVEDSRA